MAHALPHAADRIPEWLDGWRTSGRLVLLLDFDGTLAPLVSRPEGAEMPDRTRRVLEDLLASPGLYLAIVSGRGLADTRQRVRLDGIVYAGNHGMEIEGPDVEMVHPLATAARPELDSVVVALGPDLSAIEGTLLEDKGLTLSVHYRRAKREDVGRVRQLVKDEVVHHPGLHVTEGKELLEVRPEVDWHKGRAVEFLLDRLDPGPRVPVIYIGDDRTDEDAFRALRHRRGPGGGVIVADPPPPGTAATSYLRGPADVAESLGRLAAGAPR